MAAGVTCTFKARQTHREGTLRFLVVGTSGCGKSTFGRRLAAATASPFVELDGLRWAPQWSQRPDAEFLASIQAATSGERWVVDGNYSVARPMLWPRATHVVWLNFSRALVMSRILRRTLRRAALREPLWAGNTETPARAFFSRDSILLWSATTFTKNRRRYAALRAGPDFGHLSWIEFTTPQQAERYLQNLDRSFTR